MVEYVAERWRIDPERVLLTGLSDGGTFSLLAPAMALLGLPELQAMEPLERLRVLQGAIIVAGLFAGLSVGLAYAGVYAASIGSVMMTIWTWLGSGVCLMLAILCCAPFYLRWKEVRKRQERDENPFT